MAFWTQLLIGLALNIVGYMLMPKPKTVKPDGAKDMDAPTADAGRPVPVVFGTITVRGLNVLWYGDKSTRATERSS